MVKKIAAIMIVLLLAGCAQTLSFRTLDKKEGIPSISYEAYFFTAGISERSRAVFLKIPDSEVIVQPYSSEIVASTATYKEALSFMYEKRGARTISTQVVSYKDGPVGYLLRYDQAGVNMETININLTEKNGVIFFNAREETRADD